MSKLVLITLAVALASLGVATTPAAAQPPATPPVGGGTSVAPTLSEIQRMIDSATTIDPDIERYLPRWKIQEADIKIKLAQYFKSEGLPVRETDSMIVTTTFAQPNREPEILSIRAGRTGVLSGGERTRQQLGEGLYRRILDRAYAYSVIEPATPVTESERTRIPSVLYPTTARQFIAVSAFRQAVQLGTTGARIEHLIGNDEIGYHFWSSGQGKAMLHYPIIPLEDPDLRAVGVPDILTIDLGAAYRMKLGRAEDNFLGGIISPRLLNGSLGPKAVAHIEYRLPQVNEIGFAVHTEIPFTKSVASEMADITNGSVVWTTEALRSGPRPDTIRAAYFLRTIAQGNVFWETWLNDYEHFFRISLGASYQEFSRASLAYRNNNGDLARAVYPRDTARFLEGVVYEGLVHPTEVEDWIFAKVEYLNQSGFPFGMSAQIANRNLLLSGFIPVLPNWLFLEAKFSTPILRTQAAPWEQKGFFMISPILRFKID